MRSGDQAVIREPQVPRWSVRVKDIRETLWSVVMQWFAGENENLVMNQRPNWKSVKLNESWSDM